MKVIAKRFVLVFCTISLNCEKKLPKNNESFYHKRGDAFVEYFFWSTRPIIVPRPVVITIFTQCTCCPSVRPSVCLSVPKLQYQAEITAGRNCGLVEWIINDSCLVLFLIIPVAKNSHHPGNHRQMKCEKAFVNMIKGSHSFNNSFPFELSVFLPTPS